MHLFSIIRIVGFGIGLASTTWCIYLAYWLTFHDGSIGITLVEPNRVIATFELGMTSVGLFSLVIMLINERVRLKTL